MLIIVDINFVTNIWDIDHKNSPFSEHRKTMISSIRKNFKLLIISFF